MSELRRLALWRIIKVMFLLLLLAFAYVFFVGVPLSHFFDRPVKHIFDNINIGETVLKTHQGQRVWITRFSDTQRRDYRAVSAEVVNSGGCDSNVDYCALAASTDSQGIYITFSQEEPPRLPSDIAWIGGFVNPTSSAIFDLWGRAYKFSSAASLEVIELE